MKKFDLIRAWKDSAYRARLNPVQQAAAQNPAGIAEIDASLLDEIGGASNNGCGSHAMGGGGGTTMCYICLF